LAIVIVLVPVMTAITSKMNAYKVILYGSFIEAGSVFFLGLGESIVYIILFQVVLSIGEAIYSPRVYDYTANIAPPGREASYMAYSKAPMFFAKVVAGRVHDRLGGLCIGGAGAPVAIPTIVLREP
jgi:predicted MFS family arabinose efflux permease